VVSESGFSISVIGVDRGDGCAAVPGRERGLRIWTIVVGVSASGSPISVTGVDKGDGDGVV